MSIHIASTAEWFRCIRGTSAEHHAALYRLVRLLAGDASHRPPPPVSLPGRPPTAPPAAAPPPPVTPTVRYFRRAPPAGKVINAPSKDHDGNGPYSDQQLARINASFIERLERAIARGQEHPPCSIS